MPCQVTEYSALHLICGSIAGEKVFRIHHIRESGNNGRLSDVLYLRDIIGLKDPPEAQLTRRLWILISATLFRCSNVRRGDLVKIRYIQLLLQCDREVSYQISNITMLTLPMTKLTALLAAVSIVSAAPSQKRQDGCADVHIFLAKGWNEPYPGRQGKLAGSICWSLESCDYEDIYFSNAPEDDYCASVTEGAASGVAQMTAYAERCPNSKLVLSGYSQGVNVAGDILGGGGGNFGGSCNIGRSAGLNPYTSPGNKSKCHA